MTWSSLHSSAFILQIRPGMVGEYRRRHDEIWPEMTAALLATGIVRYDIFLHEPSRRVFGHVLRDRPPAADVAEDAVILKWRRFMADVLEMDGDSPVREPLERVFHLAAS
jgi:L-rhamnose mutarotase